MSGKKSSIIYHDLLSVVTEMPDDMAGKFVKQLLSLMQGEEIEIEDFSLRIALHPFIAQIKRDNEKYDRICERNKKNGMKGGRPRNPNNPVGLNGTQNNPENHDNDNDNDTDNDKYTSDSNEVRLSRLLFSKITSRNPGHKKPNLQTWAKHIDYMIRLDLRDPQQIANVIDWAQNDTGKGDWAGWQNVILSTSKLRDKFDDLILKMNPTTPKSTADQIQIDKENRAMEMPN